jgi:hypothetical protein
MEVDLWSFVWHWVRMRLASRLEFSAHQKRSNLWEVTLTGSSTLVRGVEVIFTLFHIQRRNGTNCKQNRIE